MDDQTLIRFITHCATPEETKEIARWISSSKRNSEYFFEMERMWSLKNEYHFSDKHETDMAFERLRTKTHPQSNIYRLYSWSKYVAVVVLILLLSVNLYKMMHWERAGGMNIIEVPKGELVSLILSDGTKVWLNAETTFSYPSHFSSKMREVFIEGEGYFEVSPDAGKPFWVKGDLFNVKVLGTEFNVQSYKNEDAVISLKEGKIEVAPAGVTGKNMTMNINEQIRYTTDGQTILKKKDMQSVGAWRKGEIAFYAQSLSDIVKALERKYERIIILEDKELAGMVFTCRTKSGATLMEILNLLKATNQIDYTLDNNTIVITKNNQPMEN